MKKQMSLAALAALAISSIGLAMTSPASAEDWRNHDHNYRSSDYNHNNDRRFHDGDRGRHPARYEYHRNGCATYWSWNAHRGEYVRKDRCHR